MSFQPDVPPAPELNAVDPSEYEDAEVGGTNYHREELATFLREGAWEEAFTDWAADTSLSASQWQVVQDLELIDRYDFFWDDFADRVGYHAPGLPEDWQERNLHPELESWGDVSGINAELTELGQRVCEVLKTDYVDWEAEFDAPDDLPDF